MELAINNAQCLRDVSHIGYTAVHNVCAGTVSYVSWGPFVWIFAAVLAAFLLAIFAAAAVFLYVEIRFRIALAKHRREWPTGARR